MVYQDKYFKKYLSLFSWKENILYNVDAVARQARVFSKIYVSNVMQFVFIESTITGSPANQIKELTRGRCTMTC